MFTLQTSTVASGGFTWRAMIDQTLMPALRRGLRQPPEREAVRHEMVRLLINAN